jgi:hypothetical protein
VHLCFTELCGKCFEAFAGEYSEATTPKRYPISVRRQHDCAGRTTSNTRVTENITRIIDSNGISDSETPNPRPFLRSFLGRRVTQKAVAGFSNAGQEAPLSTVLSLRSVPDPGFGLLIIDPPLRELPLIFVKIADFNQRRPQLERRLNLADHVVDDA